MPIMPTMPALTLGCSFGTPNTRTPANTTMRAIKTHSMAISTRWTGNASWGLFGADIDVGPIWNVVVMEGVHASFFEGRGPFDGLA